MMPTRCARGWERRRAGWPLALLLGLALAACNSETPPPTPTQVLEPSPAATTRPAGPSPTPPPPTPIPSPTIQPTSTPDVALLPDLYEGGNGLFAIRHPSGWTIEDLSDGGELLVRLNAPSAEQQAVVVNLVNTGGELAERQIPTLVESYLDNFFQSQRDLVTLTREADADGVQRVSAVGPGESAEEQLHLEFRFAPRGTLFTTLILMASEADWPQAAPVLGAMANSFQLHSEQAGRALPPPELPATAAEGLSLANQTVYTATTGTLYLVGEVVNEGETAYEDVRITARLIDANGATVGSETWNTKRALLAPGARSPVVVIFSTVPAGGWARVETAVAAAPATFYPDQLHPSLVIEDDAGAEATFGDYRVSGRVVNTGEMDARQVEVIGTLYAADGRVLGVESTVLDVPLLATRNSLPFDLVFFGKAEGEVARYEVVAQGLRVAP